MSLVKNENYIMIQGFMINDLKLKGNDLMVYAIIYGFSQDGENWFEGSRKYLAGWCGSTVRGITKNLDSLIKKGLLEKRTVEINNVKFCHYRAVIRSSGVGNKVHTPHEQSSLSPHEQSSPYNIDNNNIENNIEKERKKEETEKSEQEVGKQDIENLYLENQKNNLEQKKETKKTFDEIIDSYTENEQLREELKEHLKTRKSKKASLTNRAIELSFKELDKLANTDEEKIEIVQQSIMYGWTGFFELRKSNKPQKENKTSYSAEEYERMIMSRYIDNDNETPKTQETKNKFNLDEFEKYLTDKYKK